MSLIPTNYRPNTIRNIIIALMSEFNNITVDDIQPGTSAITESRTVKLEFGHKDKFWKLHQRLNQTQFDTYYQQLPKMGLSWRSITYNGERATGVRNLRRFYNTALQLSDVEEFIQDLQPVPYDLGFELDIATQSLNHFTQIIENILPHFDPNRTIRVKEFSFLNIERDLKIRNEGLSQDFLQDETEETRRYINGSISLTVEAFLYLPLSNTSNIIKQINSRYMAGPQSLGLSALDEFSTSGWDSSAAFPVPTSAWDFSGTTSGSDRAFDYYTDFI